MNGEEVLLAQVRAGSEDAFQALFEAHFAMLFRVLAYSCSDEDLAQDLAQEAFVRVWVRRSRLKPKLPFFPFVEKIARNLLLDHYKHLSVRRKTRPDMVALFDRLNEGPDAAVSLTQLEQRIRDGVLHLPDRCRTVFLLSRVEGFSHREIAAHLNIKVKTVENQVRKALMVLKKHCGDLL